MAFNIQQKNWSVIGYLRRLWSRKKSRHEEMERAKQEVRDRLPYEKLAALAKKNPPPASWRDEEFCR